MKKTLTLAVVLLIVVCIFVGCSATPDNLKGDYSFDSSLSISPEGGYTPSDASGNNYQYEDIVENGFTSTAEKNDSYFSLDRNTASYSLMRQQIMSGLTVSKNSVRLEEYVNYFSYNYPRPTDGQPLALNGQIFDTPYNSTTKLFTINVSAEEVQFQSVANNIVFLIDTSGSMYGADRLPLIQQSFTMLLDYLGEDDTVSIVTYASDVRVALEGAKGKDKTLIANVLQDLTASGSTNGAGGIQLAYQTVKKYLVEGGNNRVLLATDGDFNVGISNKEQLKEFVAEQRQNSGIYLSVLGVGMFNTNDTIMSTLATNGDGNYSYIDTVAEAYKVLVKELNGTFHVVAKDCKIGVTFNHEVVESYRLIGYETKMMSQEEFEDNQKDAGEIGSGHTVTAVYEIKLTSDEFVLTDEHVIATAELKYKDPTDGEDAISKSITKTFTWADYTTTPNEDCVFIGCVVEFGLILRQSEYKADSSLAKVIQRLQSLNCVATDDFKGEFLQIVQKAFTSEKYKNNNLDY